MLNYVKKKTCILPIPYYGRRVFFFLLTKWKLFSKWIDLTNIVTAFNVFALTVVGRRVNILSENASDPPKRFIVSFFTKSFKRTRGFTVGRYRCNKPESMSFDSQTNPSKEPVKRTKQIILKSFNCNL